MRGHLYPRVPSSEDTLQALPRAPEPHKGWKVGRALSFSAPNSSSTRQPGRHGRRPPSPGAERLLRRRPGLQGGSGNRKLRTACGRLSGPQPCAAWRSGVPAARQPRAGAPSRPWRQVNYREPEAPRPGQHHVQPLASSPRRTRTACRAFLSLPPKSGSRVPVIT